MGIKICPSCSERLTALTEKCPTCGIILKKTISPVTIGISIIALLLVLVIIGLVLF